MLFLVTCCAQIIELSCDSALSSWNVCHANTVSVNILYPINLFSSLIYTHNEI